MAILVQVRMHETYLYVHIPQSTPISYIRGFPPKSRSSPKARTIHIA